MEAAAQDEHDDVFSLVLAGYAAQVVRTLASLSVAEHLEHGALTAAQIAQRASSDPDMTYRVLRAAVGLGMLKYDKASTTFTGTGRLGIVHKDSPFTLKHYAQALAGPAFWHTLLRLPDAVRRGRDYVQETLGGDLWDYFAEHDEEARTFRTAMTDVSRPVVRDAGAVIDTSRGGFVVDVGGAEGTFVSELLQRNPRLTGAVLDLQQAMPAVAEQSRSWGVSDRMTGIAGDFFESVPAADYYLLKFVLHDWSDESCIEILSNIRRAMNPGARLFVVEMIVGDNDSSTHAALLDMVMLTIVPGLEREMAEFERLLDAADLAVVRTAPLHRPYQLIEAQAR